MRLVDELDQQHAPDQVAASTWLRVSIAPNLLEAADAEAPEKRGGNVTSLKHRF
jgi:hypothetical protein